MVMELIKIIDQAIYWYEKSAEQGYKKAKKKVKKSSKFS